MRTVMFLNNAKKYLPYYLDYYYISSMPEKITEKVLEFYGQRKEVTDMSLQLYAEVIKYYFKWLCSFCISV